MATFMALLLDSLCYILLNCSFSVLYTVSLLLNTSCLRALPLFAC